MDYFPFQQLPDINYQVTLFPYAKNEDMDCIVSFMRTMSTIQLYNPHLIMVNTSDNLDEYDLFDFQYDFNLIENRLGLHNVKIIQKSSKPLYWIFNSALILKAYEFAYPGSPITENWMPRFTMYKVECPFTDKEEEIVAENGETPEKKYINFTLCYINADPIFFTQLVDLYINSVSDVQEESPQNYGLITTRRHTENLDAFMDIFNQCVAPDFVFTNNEFITRHYENYIQKNDPNEEFQFSWKSEEAVERFEKVNRYLNIRNYI